MPKWFSGVAAADTGRRGLVVLVVAYLVLIVTVAGLVHQSRAGERDALLERSANRIVTTAGSIGTYVTELHEHQTDLAERRLRGDITPATFIDLAQDQGFDAALVLDATGRVIVSAPAGEAAPGTPLGRGRTHLEESLGGQAAVSGVVTAAVSNERLVALSVPYTDVRGERRVFSGGYRVGETPLHQFLQNVSGLSQHRAYLIDAGDGIITARGSVEGDYAVLRAAAPDLAAALTTSTGGTARIQNADSYFTSATVPGTTWRLVFTAPLSEVYAPLEGPGAWVPWLVLAAFTVTGLFAIGVAHSLHAQGNRLATSQARTTAILAGTPDAFIGIDEHTRITDWNPAAEAMLGWPAAEVLGRRADDVFVPEQLRERHNRMVEALAEGREVPPVEAAESFALHRDGGLVPVELVVSAMGWGSGWRMHGFIRDMTPRRRAERELRTLAGIVAATGDAILSKKLDGAVMTWNPAAERLYGYPAEEMVGQNVRILVPQERRSELTALMKSAAAGIEVPPFETVRRRKDGSLVDVSLSVAPLFDADGTVIGACATARDITDAIRQASELREAEELFRLAFDAVPVGMVLTSLAEHERGRLLRVNGGFCWMLGYTEEELLARTFGDITHPDDVEAEVELLAPFIEGKQRTIRFEKRYVRGDGSTVWAMVSSAVVDGPDGQPRYAVTQVEDITARRAEQERLTALALADPLTGLANRVLFDDRLAQAVHRAGRHDRTVAVVYCDLDDFKPVNDRFGHGVGDELLQQVGHRLMVAMRPSDTVARLGGDEFAVVCEDLPSAETAITIADRVRETVEGTYLVSAGAVRIGCSVGVATATGADIESRELVARADLSMFSDKRTRRAGDPFTVVRDRRSDAITADHGTERENVTPSSSS